MNLRRRGSRDVDWLWYTSMTGFYDDDDDINFLVLSNRGVPSSAAQKLKKDAMPYRYL
jgi:hypothetical protein